MKITPDLFEAFLKCPTKCWLRATNEIPSGNAYAEWVRSQDNSYRGQETARLTAELPKGDLGTSPEVENLKSAKWRLATNVVVRAQEDFCAVETSLHAVERIPSAGRGQPAQFIPIRFIYRNKLTKDDKLLLAFEAFVLSEILGRAVSLGKIIHGDSHATLKVKTAALAGEVRKRLGKITVLLASPASPDLVLNRHCAECEFQARCRKLAVEKDDLSLLAGMSAKERQKLRSKGIFTVTQLSYTFRPRRRPKRLRDQREKYHHALKALAIREQKIHIVGSPELKLEGTPVYLDVEGLPDRDFYYLIGVRIGHGDSAAQHSLWADTVADEGRIWREFLALLETIERPVLIYYGSYETDFFQSMSERYSAPDEGSTAATALVRPVNLLALIYAQIYFPTYSNSLKEIGVFVKHQWSVTGASGPLSIASRSEWECSRSPSIKDKLINYNSDDCTALNKLTALLNALCSQEESETVPKAEDFVRAEDLRSPKSYMWQKIEFAMPEFDFINRAAHWIYQRNRIYARTNPRLRHRPSSASKKLICIDKSIDLCGSLRCPVCGFTVLKKRGYRRKLVLDLRFHRRGISRCVTNFRSFNYTCESCGARIPADTSALPKDRYGSGFVAYLLYQMTELVVPQVAIMKCLNDLFHLSIGNSGQFTKVIAKAAEYYKPTYESIIKRLCDGTLLHADETKAVVKGTRAYVWVFTNLDEVAYVYSDTREGSLLKSFLASFKGVLVSDFYAAYDSIDCPQQKCLVHLLRDLNTDLLQEPFNKELTNIASGFGALMKSIVQTIDRFGLRARFLNKHHEDVAKFISEISSSSFESNTASGYKRRFEKYQNKLFTFLNYDNVAWNNNNAECAVKAFVRLRKVIRGASTEDSLHDHLVLLSLCETCKFTGVDFLDFLRSGEKDIHAFAESRRRRRKSSPPGIAQG